MSIPSPQADSVRSASSLKPVARLLGEQAQYAKGASMSLNDCLTSLRQMAGNCNRLFSVHASNPSLVIGPVMTVNLMVQAKLALLAVHLNYLRSELQQLDADLGKVAFQEAERTKVTPELAEAPPRAS